MSSVARVLLAGVLLVGAAAAVRAAPGDLLGNYLGKTRILLVSAPSPDDPRLQAQRHIFAGLGKAAQERDLVLVVAVGNGAAARAARRRYQLADATFSAVLIGKDGGSKARTAMPFEAAELLRTIDAMPMRREEMRRRR